MAHIPRYVPVVKTVKLNSQTAKKIVIKDKKCIERTMMIRTDVWHEFKILKGAYFNREEILRCILDAVEPANLVPVRYRVVGQDALFLAGNCAMAIEKLCQTRLIIARIEYPPLVLSISLAVAFTRDIQINLQQILTNVLNSRMNQEEKVLNLENFHSDPQLHNVTFYPLSQISLFANILNLIKINMFSIESLNLKNNRLTSLVGLENIGSPIKNLDLRHNSLLSMKDLSPIKNMNITELWLDNNPVCENYSTPEKYINSALNYCPMLTMLDGIEVGSGRLPLPQGDYFQTNIKRSLIQQFVTHFFNLYDQDDRNIMRGLYKDNAFFSITRSSDIMLNHGASKITINIKSRNLLDKLLFEKEDNQKYHTNLHFSQDEILKEINKLPKSFHDKKSMVYDCGLVHSTNNKIMFSVYGIVKIYNEFYDSVLGFSRTFLIESYCNHEYKVANDLYLLCLPPKDMKPELIITNVPTIDSKIVNLSTSEKVEMIHNLKSTTTMNLKWSRKYLEKNNWDLKKTITNFMDDYTLTIVPEEAFAEESTLDSNTQTF